MLEDLVPAPRKLEMDAADLAAPWDVVWAHVRHADLAESPLVRALFAVRTRGRPSALRLDDLRSSPERPGFQILGETERSVTVGAIGKVWHLDIPFRHVDDAAAFARFDEPGYVKVAWTLRVEPVGETSSRVVVEVRVDGTDEDSWTKFTRYWRLVGPGSHFIRRALLAGLARRFASHEEDRSLAGDTRLPDAGAQMTFGIDIAAEPDAVWPWLVQMGAGRAGFYTLDAVDNDGLPSAREIHPELQKLGVGDLVPTGDGEGFEVLTLAPARALVLGGLFDIDAGRQLPFESARPPRYWHMTWAFVLERAGENKTRLHVRARAAFSPSERLHAAWIRPVHALMQTAQLRHLAARAEGRLPRDTWRDVGAGFGGAAIMTMAWLTPFLRAARRHWGLDAEEAARPRVGDALVPEPTWSWTHGIEIDAPADHVWPWVAQIGAGRGGFYSYQWLENLVGCDVRNAETIHPEWAHREGDALVLHPKMPPLRVVAVESGRSFVAFADRGEDGSFAAVSWAFLVEPLGPTRCRVVSRFRTACGDDVATRLAQGPFFLEPIGFAMDRRMLLGIRARALRA